MGKYAVILSDGSIESSTLGVKSVKVWGYLIVGGVSLDYHPLKGATHNS